MQVLRDLAVRISYETRNRQIKISLCWMLELPWQNQGAKIEMNGAKHQFPSWFGFSFSPTRSQQSRQQHLCNWKLQKPQAVTQLQCKD